MLKEQVIFFYFVRLGQKHKNSACFTSFALKCLNFAQILERFAQLCDFMTSTFRSSDEKLFFCPKGNTMHYFQEWTTLSLTKNLDWITIQIPRMLYKYICVVCTYWIGASNLAKHAELRQQHVAITRHTPKVNGCAACRYRGVLGHGFTHNLDRAVHVYVSPNSSLCTIPSRCFIIS